MKVIDIEGDLFADLKQGDTIAHGCNCSGVMGAGVAKPIKDMFPDNYKRYKQLCEDGTFRPGSLCYKKEKGIGIYNLGTQFKPGKDAHIVNVDRAVREMVRFAAFRDEWEIKTVRLGCGIGGLQWDDVKLILEKIDFPGELLVYYMEMK